MADAKYKAVDLNDIDDAFDVFASDQRAMIGRFSKTARDKREREIEASVWDRAADMLRRTTLTGVK